jgi:hypothetical protein
MASTIIPKYKQRRWDLFKEYIEKPAIKVAILEYKTKHPQRADSRDNIIHASILGLLCATDLPEGCSTAFARMLTIPEPTEAELIGLIESPITIIDHVNRMVLPEDTESVSYRKIMHFEGRRESNFEPEYLETDNGVYLRISPYTNKTELRAFIDEFFDLYISKLAVERGINLDGLNQRYIDPDKRVRTRQRVNIEIDRYIFNNISEKSSDLVTDIKRLFNRDFTKDNIRKAKSEIRNKKRSF